MADYEIEGKSSLDATPFVRSIARMDAALANLERRINKVDREIDKLARKEATIRIRLDTKSVDSGLAKIERRINALRSKTVRINTIENVSTQQSGAGAPSSMNRTDQVTVRVTQNGAEETERVLHNVENAAEGIPNNIVINIETIGGEKAARDLDSVGRAAERDNRQFSLMTGAIAAGIPLLGPGIAAAAGVGIGAIGGLTSAVAGGAGAFLAGKNAASQLNAALSAQAAVDKALASGDKDKITAALKAQQAAMDALGPSGQKTLDLYKNFKDTLSHFGDSFKDTTFDIFNKGLTAATTLLQKAEPVAASAARGIDSVVTKLNQRIDAGGFDKFFDYLERTAGPTIDKLGTGVLNFVQTFTNLLPHLQPIIDMVSNGFLKMSESALKWSEGLDQNQGFQKFVSYVTEYGPKVWQVIKDIAKFIGDLIVAAAPLGGPILAAIDGLVKVLDALVSTDFGQFLVQMGIMAALFKQIGGMTGLPGIISGVASSLGNRPGGLASSMNQAGGAASALAIGLPALGAIVGGVAAQHGAATDTEEQWAQAIMAGGQAAVDAYNTYKNGSYWGRSIDEATGLAASWSDAEARAKELYGQMDPLSRAQFDVASAQQEMNRAYADGGPTTDRFKTAAYNFKLGLDELTKATGENQYAMLTLNDANQLSIGTVNGLIGRVAALGQQKAVPVLDANTAPMDTKVTSASDLLGQLAGMKPTPQANLGTGLFDYAIAVTNNQITTLGNQKPTPQVGLFKGLFDNVLAVANGQIMQLGNQKPTPQVGMVKGLFDNVLSVANGQIMNLANQRPTPVVNANPGPFSSIYSYVMSSVNAIASQQPTPTVYARDNATGTLNSIRSSINSIPVSKTVTVNVIGKSALSSGGPVTKAATGRVVGPGTSTSDSVPAIGPGGSRWALSDGEFVMRARAVKKYGMGFMAALNSGHFDPIKMMHAMNPITIPSGSKRGSDGGSMDAGGGQRIGQYIEEGAVVVHNYHPTDTGTSVTKELARLGAFGAFGDDE